MSDLTKTVSSAPYLLRLIGEQKLDPLKLSTHQRRVCIRFLIQERSHTQREIAAILRINEGAVSRHKRHIQDQNVWMLDHIDERRIAIELMQTAEAAIARLFRSGKERDAWVVARECVEMLQTLGYINKKPLEIDLKGQVTLQEILKLASQPQGSGDDDSPEGSDKGRPEHKNGYAPFRPAPSKNP